MSFGTPEMTAYPYPFYDKARKAGHALPVPGQAVLPVPHFLTTHYDDTIAVARDYQHFSSLRPVLSSGDPEFDAIRAQGWPAAPGLVTNDPPAHTRYRKLVNRAFTTGAVKRQEPVMTAIIDELIDGFARRGSCELMADFAMPLPTRYTGLMLGVPEEEQAQFQHWSDEVAEYAAGYLDRERALEVTRSLVRMQHYWAAKIEERRNDPGDDLISLIVTAEEDAELPLDLPSLLELIRVFMTGGTESTASMLGSAMYLLLTHPEQMAAVRADRSLIPRMLEEALRLESPVQYNPRTVAADAEIGGCPIPKGSRVILNWGAANRDPAVYGPDADRFDIHRDGPTQLAFGHAYHLCVGAPISRAEGRIAFERLFDRLDHIRLAVPADEVRFVGHGMVRRISSLPLRFTAR